MNIPRIFLEVWFIIVGVLSYFLTAEDGVSPAETASSPESV